MHDGKSFFRIVLLPFYPEPQALSRCRYLWLHLKEVCLSFAR
ncbi:hypothetical protein HMPREF3213_03465 [Heyndrickxia coagulans]|uniref:Uncharacterized protein n=1 Tax=Heyndrickxia coagulans TaxID=1398 RepID=A0A0C5C5Q3_HEYCO|nr:hypothetical protein SB48_HM08orf04522 [Heyndrickxia coagulans]KWZ77051.1 hypothetical protein HMPREF3213_03465 [Heyndrickxia coagulans]